MTDRLPSPWALRFPWAAKSPDPEPLEVFVDLAKDKDCSVYFVGGRILDDNDVKRLLRSTLQLDPEFISAK